MDVTASANLGRFGHHPDPAIDFEVEVEDIEAEFYDLKINLAGCCTHGELLRRIDRAMDFRVGGVPSTVAAKDQLRELEAAIKSHRPKPSDHA